MFTSFDVDAFEVPGGRDEIWRFTPLKRLRGLHDGSAAADRGHGAARIEVSECAAASPSRRCAAATSDSDRAACPPIALPPRRSRRSTARRSSPSRRTSSAIDPIEIVVTGPGEGATAYGHLQVRVDELGEAVVVIDQRGSGTYADNIEFVVGTPPA